MKFSVRTISAVAALCAGGMAHAQFLPPSVEATLDVGETAVFNGTLTLPSAGADRVDVFFLIDDTGSMGGIINNAKNGASAILSALPSTYRYGVASYDGDPSEGVTAANAFNRRTDLTLDRTAITNGLNAIFAGGGGDAPEANLYALREAANTSSWDAGSQRLVVMFGDVPGHVNTVTTAQAADAMVAAGAKLIAFNSSSAGSGLDGRDTSPAEPVGTRQASDIIAAAGGALVNNFASLSSAAFVSAVTSQITSAVSLLDLVFGNTFTGSGLSLAINCTDSRGCDDVAAGDSRSFSVAVTGVSAGLYDFDVFARGISSVQDFTIRVGEATGGGGGGGDPVPAIPEPSTYALMLAGLAGVGWMARRRRRSDA
jgi:von Willebrand factor type A domain/PEP-CTERM motif